MFAVDLSKYRLVDLTCTIDPAGQPEGRPFRITRGHLADNSFKHDIETHSHVGTHIESPAHFFDGGKDLTAFDLDIFMGPAAVFDVDLAPSADAYFTADMLEKGVGELVARGHILLVRNSNPASIEAGAKDERLLPKFGKDACEWIRDREVKLLGVDERTVGFGASVEETRRFHDILMSADICVIETLRRLDALRRKTFYLLALPIPVRGLDSAWARVVAIEEI